MGDAGGSWGDAVQDWSVWLRAAGRAETTIATRVDHVRRLSRAVPCGPWAVDGPMLLSWAGGQSWARETRRSVRTSVRGFYGWAVRAGHVEGNPADVLPAVTPGPARPRPAPEIVYREALGRAGGDDRSVLILRLAAEAGLRRAEIAGISSGDVVADLLGSSLLVHGKGGRQRVVPLSADLTRLLAARGPGWAFPGDDGGHLSPRWVGKLATRLLPGDWTLHTLRHRFATRAYGQDRDVLAVQTLLGHASPVTTRRYVAIDQEWLRRAAAAAS